MNLKKTTLSTISQEFRFLDIQPKKIIYSIGLWWEYPGN